MNIYDTYRYVPQKIIKNSAIMSCLCSVAAAVVLLLSFTEKYRFVWQTSFAVFATIAIQLTVRFILSNYIFILDDVNFIITRTYSKNSKQLCNINLKNSLGIFDKKPSKEVERDIGKIEIRRSFCQNLWAGDKEYIYVFEFDEKICAIKFNADENFIIEIKRRIEEANLRYGE